MDTSALDQRDNVIANHAFGFQVSESGSSYTWSLNGRENQGEAAIMEEVRSLLACYTARLALT